MSYSVIDMSDFEGRRRPVAQALGAEAIKVNQFDSQPDHAGHEHDEIASGQEEIYVPLRGNGFMTIGGERVELRPGRYVLVGPAEVRQVVAGPAGLSYLVIGARLGGEAG